MARERERSLQAGTTRAQPVARCAQAVTRCAQAIATCTHPGVVGGERTRQVDGAGGGALGRSGARGAQGMAHVARVGLRHNDGEAGAPHERLARAVIAPGTASCGGRGEGRPAPQRSPARPTRVGRLEGEEAL
eukprot:scaffold52525_cov75-Phaeocystis_antarctica.AAC.2